MSQMIVSQKMKRTCEGCGLVREWELVALDEATILEMQEWIFLGRELYANGQWVKVMIHACSAKCLAAAEDKITIARLQAPPEEPVDNIDLSALRIN